MADLARIDKEDIYSRIDVKTHRKDTRFNMPNARRSSSLPDSKSKISYQRLLADLDQVPIQGVTLTVSEVLFSPIEFLDWRCLTVGAPERWQIQIANANEIRVMHQYSRKRWISQLCRSYDGFLFKRNR